MISNGIFQRPRRDVFGVLGYGGAEILGKSDKECCEERVYEVCGAMCRNIRHEQLGKKERYLLLSSKMQRASLQK